MVSRGDPDRPIFCDIDGTLTENAHQANGKVIESRIEKLLMLIAEGRQVVVWSSRGTAYAKKFVDENGLVGVVTPIGKPDLVIDDNPDITNGRYMPVHNPEDYFDG